jgi:hypothetical protein
VPVPRPESRTRVDPRPDPQANPRTQPRPRPPIDPAPDPRTRTKQRPQLRYVTYTKLNTRTGRVYVGRASGYGTPADIVARRDRAHHMSLRGYGPALPDRSAPATRPFLLRHLDPAYHAIRGREQQMIDAFGGSIREKGLRGTRSGNTIRGVKKDHMLGRVYDAAASARFGRIAPYTGR